MAIFPLLLIGGAALVAVIGLVLVIFLSRR